MSQREQVLARFVCLVTSANAVGSILSRLLQAGQVVKDAGAKYSLVSQLVNARRQQTASAYASVRPTSIAGQSYVVLKMVGRPMDGEEIATQLQAEGKTINPRSVMTALYHYAQDGQLFRLVSPKTFGLLEWEQENILSSHEKGEMTYQENEVPNNDQQQSPYVSGEESGVPSLPAEDAQLP